ncbi:hypothetical protein DAH55_00960 [Sphingomonas koreensis]|uniref:hypothetical protein n=1 Tax=Sphingomonas koreensis TaxID=93064 RepID=UPI00082FA9B1|nr:hypothetical protein [Sphingomonas koreensis]PJI87572.1 hypothetical protein BDW16_0813 [Sphingomonas koreensis]RSU62950.1 hypothetical protein DAH56_03325 [Sphingomonas koreensis]RSU71661.1 hypothetical protein DAH55_00960 [Sphingomonas koreensis]
MPAALVAASMLLAAAPLAASRNGVYTPAAGSAERTAIIRTLKGGNDAGVRYTFRRFHVFHERNRAISYVEGEGGIGGFQAILTREGKAPWRVVWGEGDGGSDSCAAGAKHYGWAVRLIRSYSVAPDTLFPGITVRTSELKRMAAREPETQCVGDLDGGPE